MSILRTAISTSRGAIAAAVIQDGMTAFIAIIAEDRDAFRGVSGALDARVERHPDHLELHLDRGIRVHVDLEAELALRISTQTRIVFADEKGLEPTRITLGRVVWPA